MAADAEYFPHVFRPLTIGGMTIANRIMAPPHGLMVGDPLGPEPEAARYFAYWLERVANGLSWIDGLNVFIDNRIVPRGYLPSGLGAIRRGTVHHPLFRDRISRYAEQVHAGGAVLTAQLINQGGMPHSASGILANHANNQPTHAMTPDEIGRIVDEYAQAARAALDCGLDGVELHANHEDVLHLFLSPATNQRADEWGGTRERRLKFLTDAIAAIRAEVGSRLTVGVRLNMDEFIAGGYGVDEGLAIAGVIEATGQVDWFHGVVGNNWGAPSYIQPPVYGAGAWADLAGRYRAQLRIPVVYTGRVTTPAVAEDILARGLADVVGVARGFFADPAFVSKARAGQAAQIIPCVGCNECIHAVVVEKLPFGCAVNPRTGREGARLPVAATPRRVTVVGAGPAGMEAAATAAERGHAVTLIDAAPAPGGQLRLMSALPENRGYDDYVALQTARLRALGVVLRSGVVADADLVLATQPDVVVLATGSRPRGHDVPGADLPCVVEARDLLSGAADCGPRALIVAREDHMQPLSVAAHLADRGVQVRLIYQTTGIAPLVGKYSIGGIMARLTAKGAEVRVMERVTHIAPSRVTTQNVYSGVEASHTGFDTVVLACGGSADTGLYPALAGRVPALHVIGDAYVPGRVIGATRQGYETAMQL